MNRAKAELWRRRFALIYLFGSWNLLGYVIYAYPIGKNSRQTPPDLDTGQEVHYYIKWLGLHITAFNYKQGPEGSLNLKSSFKVTDDADPEE